MAYFLPVENEMVQVCQKFLINTLDVTQKFLNYTYSHKSPLNTPQGDRRGKSKKRLTTDE